MLTKGETDTGPVHFSDFARFSIGGRDPQCH